MSLADTLSTMAATLAGRRAPEETARMLGVEPRGVAFYAKLAQKAREALLAGMFPHARHAVTRDLGVDAWHALVEAYFEAHAERSFVRHANARAFPAFVATHGGAPAWLAELADFEWHEWQVEIAPRVASDDEPAVGPLRACSTLRVRSYAHDIVAWIDERDRAGEPFASPTACAFWQGAQAVSFRNALAPAHLAALADLERAEPDTLEELRGAEIVLGGT
jgi:hypothetical protein